MEGVSTPTDNHVEGDFDPSRDRGAFGGGVYANNVDMERCVVSGNSVLGGGAAGGGVFSVGGADSSRATSSIAQSSVTGRKAQSGRRRCRDDRQRPRHRGHADRTLADCGQYCHEIGGASYGHDIFTGSTFYFQSLGYNRLGVLDFSQMLVPVGEPNWESLSWRHYPQAGDEDGYQLDSLLNLVSGVTRSARIRSVGVDAPEFAVLTYEPWDQAVDQIPPARYPVDEVLGEYSVRNGATDDFLSIVLDRIESTYGLIGFAAQFTADFEAFLQSVDTDESLPGNQPYRSPDGEPILTLADTHWFGPAQTWPKEVSNWPYIEFWHRLDAALLAEGIPGMGPEALGDDAWESLFSSGPLVENPNIVTSMDRQTRFQVLLEPMDQLGASRPASSLGDVGALEIR